MVYQKALGTAAHRKSVVGQSDRIYANLSAAKQNALLTCLDNNGLQKQAGRWGGLSGAAISGTTVADLGRDGLLTINSKRNSAWLTDRGVVAMGWHHKAAELLVKQTVPMRESASATS
jgi:hypothetical protein